MTSESDSALLVRDNEIFNDIRNCVRRKINNSDNIFFGDNHASQREDILKLLTQSIVEKESNSAIICGPPGCGKTALLNNVLKELCSTGMIDNENAVIVRLNGLLDTDGCQALRDIRKQLRVTYEPKVSSFSSYQNNLMYLFEKLMENDKEETMPCVIIILEEFHMFCDHKNQLLLYNLFDIAQQSAAPLCIIGLTYFSDIMNMMEKRVLSRFSHRIIWMSEVVKLEDRLKLFHDIFTLHPSDLPKVDKIYKVIWNKRTNELVANREVIEVLKKQLDIDSNQRKFRNILHKLFNTVTFELPLLNVENIKHAFSIQDTFTSVMATMSLLEMALIISIKHQLADHPREPFNFEMVYSQYMRFSGSTATNLVTEKSVVLKAFQRFHDLEMVIPVRRSWGNTTGKVPLEYIMYHSNITDDQISEAMRLNKDIIPELRHWAMQTI